MSATIHFRSLAEGSAEEFQRLAEFEERENAELGERLLAELERQTSTGGVAITRKEHALQSATRAYRDGRDEEYVVVALLHDIGELWAPYDHGGIMAVVLRPFVRPELTWIVQHHVTFQEYYFAHHLGGDRNARDVYREHPLFEACAEFCELYDQTSFDPEYDSLELQFFAPMVRRVFAEPRYLATPAFDDKDT
jgi:predicted HD phosphohydrolase